MRVSREKEAPVVVRLEGGIGDHLLGMRVLPYVKRRFPDRRLMVLSDAGGSPTQAEIATMSPHVDKVVTVRQRAAPGSVEEMGRLENLDRHARDLIQSAFSFIDAWGNTFFLQAARTLQVPVLEILAASPTLRPPPEAEAEAERIVAPLSDRVLVGMSLAKLGQILAQENWDAVRTFVAGLLAHPQVVILNLFTTQFNFGQWPEGLRGERERIVRLEAEFLRALSDSNERIVSVENASIGALAALLGRCRYFVGLDNGIKHLAWSLGIPRTHFGPEVPDGLFILRWMPDYHRLLLYNASAEERREHFDFAMSRLSGGA